MLQFYGEITIMRRQISMKISTKGRYALRMLVDMAQPPHEFEEPGKLCKVSQYPTKEEIEAVFAAIS